MALPGYRCTRLGSLAGRASALRFCRSLALSRSFAVRRPADPADLSDLDFWLKGAHVVKVEFENKLAIFVAALAAGGCWLPVAAAPAAGLEVNPLFPASYPSSLSLGTGSLASTAFFSLFSFLFSLLSLSLCLTEHGFSILFGLFFSQQCNTAI
jgi:hypothetical protein